MQLSFDEYGKHFTQQIQSVNLAAAEKTRWDFNKYPSMWILISKEFFVTWILPRVGSQCFPVLGLTGDSWWGRSSGARPPNDISIEFEIRWKFGAL